MGEYTQYSIYSFSLPDKKKFKAIGNYGQIGCMHLDLWHNIFSWIEQNLMGKAA